MSHAAPRRHPVRSGLAALSTALVLAAAGPYGLASPAFAALPGHTMAGDFTSFNIDGDMAGPNDWNSLYGPGPTPQGRPSTGAVKSSIQADPCDNAADDKVSGKIFDRSDPENDATHVDGWLKDTGKPTSKSDICQAGVAAEVVNVGGQYHYVLYEFIQRKPSGHWLPEQGGTDRG